jgi:hypothetical protein
MLNGLVPAFPQSCAHPVIDAVILTPEPSMARDTAHPQRLTRFEP